ncbi:hypothetical protein DIPPA_34589 [Diplonema papillatum]|nr:hypothetical protein DIPPA_34589 [Diplonema papillatum]|eukprot:gene6330-9697_t
MHAIILTWLAVSASGDRLDVSCENEAMYKEQAGCLPSRCGSVSVDDFVPDAAADVLLKIAKKGLAMGKVTGPAGIVDLAQGIVSFEDQFVRYNLMAKERLTAGIVDDLLTVEEVEAYRSHVRRLRDFVIEEFGSELQGKKLYLALPAFFSKLSAGPGVTENDEYWHQHIDTEQYGTFVFTTLTYLNSQGVDFEGGSLMINGKEVRPKKGKIAAFTSGTENPHFVERVTDGTRYALTTAFTCQPPPAGIDIETVLHDIPVQPARGEEDL